MTRLPVVATLLFAVLLTGALAFGTARFKAANACQQVVIASSQEKAGMLSSFAAAYNRLDRQVAGRCVSISVEQVNSGDAELALETGWVGQTYPRPDVWSPASSAWVVLLKQSGPAEADRLLPHISASLFQSPLVIGMPKPMADQLGYPTRKIGWSDIRDLIQDPQGWGRYGKSQWGPFRLGKTNPTVSTSGLHALIGTYYAASGGNLTAEVVAADSVRAYVAEIEKSVVHYGETASEFLQNLQNADKSGEAAVLDYVSAIALEEKQLVDYNSGLVAGVQSAVPRTPLVAIYPKDGTPVADHPYVVLRWSKAAAAALDFQNFLGEGDQRAAIDKNNFRSSGVGKSLGEHRFVQADQPVLVLQPPTGPGVLTAMIEGWKRARKPARVLILIDTAVDKGSLSEAISSLQTATSGFLGQDRVGIWTFPALQGQPASYNMLLDVSSRGSPSTSLAGVRPTDGPSDLNGVLRKAVADMVASYDPNAINAVLVLELAPVGRPALDEGLASDLRRQDSSKFVRVFTVGPSSAVLRTIALAARGTFYPRGSTFRFLNDVISNF